MTKPVGGVIFLAAVDDLLTRS